MGQLPPRVQRQNHRYAQGPHVPLHPRLLHAPDAHDIEAGLECAVLGVTHPDGSQQELRWVDANGLAEDAGREDWVFVAWGDA